MSFLHYKFGYVEGLDYSQLPGFERLNAGQQRQIHEAFETAYRASTGMGLKIALGKAHETAKCMFNTIQSMKPVVSTAVPPSIFEGLDNC